MKVYVDTENKFIEKFNTRTGFYICSGVIENGKDTGVDPFICPLPMRGKASHLKSSEIFCAVLVRNVLTAYYAEADVRS